MSATNIILILQMKKMYDQRIILKEEEKIKLKEKEEEKIKLKEEKEKENHKKSEILNNYF